MGRVFVVGVGMTKFEKPGTTDNDYPELVKEAVTKALQDCNVAFSEIEQAVVGFVNADSTSAQRAIYEFGMTGIPIYNVNNNCASGSTAIILAKQFVESGINDCVLAVGFEIMERGSLNPKFEGRAHPTGNLIRRMRKIAGMDKSPLVAQLFGNAGIEHMKKYGTSPEHFAKIAHKNHKHSVNNPNALLRDEYSVEEILASPKIFGPLTKLQCCPNCNGAGAAVIVSEKFVKTHGLEAQAVEILAMEMATDMPNTFTEGCAHLIGYDLSKRAAESAFEKAGCKPSDVQVIELHDCFSTAELIAYEALGLCAPGKGAELVDRGDNTYGGKYVVNPSGGLLSKGHPLGATGLAQCHELCSQLRGEAGARQVPGAKVALQHNFGAGGAAIVGIYRLGFPENSKNSINKSKL